MGACESIERKEIKEQNAISRRIDRELQPKNEMRRKLLLLGPGESGKSTCLKQMKILHHNGFTEAEILEKKLIVYANILQAMVLLLQVMEAKAIQFGNDAMETSAAVVKKMKAEDLHEIPEELARALKALWQDKGVRMAFEYRNEFHITESASYFFDDLDRISKRDYRPTSQDILHTRVATTGVVQVFFTFKGIQFEVFDVGGQRSERRKWIHCFDDCNAIIYVAAISEYDQVLKEDDKTNRLSEAIELFGGVANSNFFTNCSLILFLNKKDLFEEKIKRIPLNKNFIDFKGTNDYNTAVDYIRNKFHNKVRNKRIPYTHETCATDTNQVQVVINSVIDQIVQENLKDTGMI